MSARNPAAPILRRAAQRMHQRAAELAKRYSVGGAGRIWRDPKRLQEYEEAKYLALNLKRISGAIGRSQLVDGIGNRLDLVKS